MEDLTTPSMGRFIIQNPYNDSKAGQIARAKELSIELIDLVMSDFERVEKPTIVQSMVKTNAVMGILNAQMAAVKSLSLNYE